MVSSLSSSPSIQKDSHTQNIRTDITHSSNPPPASRKGANIYSLQRGSQQITEKESSSSEVSKNNSFFEAAKRKLGIRSPKSNRVSQNDLQPHQPPQEVGILSRPHSTIQSSGSNSPSNILPNSNTSQPQRSPHTHIHTTKLLIGEAAVDHFFDLIASLVRMYDALATAMYSTALQKEKEARKAHKEGSTAAGRSGSAGIPTSRAASTVSAQSPRNDSTGDSLTNIPMTQLQQQHQSNNGGNSRNSKNNRTAGGATNNNNNNSTSPAARGGSAPVSPTSSSNHFTSTPPSSAGQLRVVADGDVSPSAATATPAIINEQSQTGKGGASGNSSRNNRQNQSSTTANKQKNPSNSQIRRDRQNNNKSNNPSSPLVSAVAFSGSQGRGFSNDESDFGSHTASVFRDDTPIRTPPLEQNGPSSMNDWHDVGGDTASVCR